jgi:hypothetical protein
MVDIDIPQYHHEISLKNPCPGSVASIRVEKGGFFDIKKPLFQEAVRR